MYLDIPRPTYRNKLLTVTQSTKDITKAIIKGIRESLPQAKASADKFKGNTKVETLNNLWTHLKYRYNYQAEPVENQTVKTLARIYRDRNKGNDCKHFTTFVTVYCLTHKIPVMLRLVSFKQSDRTPTHIYPVAIVNGKEIPVDAVINQFGVNPRGVKFKKDIPLNF
jgi:hypothetical protein